MTCGDVLSLEDLQTAKKHQIFEAEVITGKQGGTAGGSDIDYATNQVTGQTQKTLPAVLRDAGFRPAPFDFVIGGTLATGDRNRAVFNPAPTGDNNWYAWQGSLPKIVPAGSTPATNGGLGDGAWKPVTNNILAPTVRESIRRSYAEAGYNLVAGSFQSGFTLANANDVALDDATGKAFSGQSGVYTAGTTTNGFVDRSNVLLRDTLPPYAGAALDRMVLLSETAADETVVGKLQGFEYDEDSNRCFLVSYLPTGNPYPRDEAITIAEYSTDQNGAIVSLIARAFNLGFGHGEALLVDTSVPGKTYLWISTSDSGSGASAVRRIEWAAGPVGSPMDFPLPYTLFSFADRQNGDVLLLANGQNHYVPFERFKAGDFTPRIIETRAPLEDSLVIAGGNQAFKKRYGLHYGLCGFNINTGWASKCYLTAGDTTLRLACSVDNSPKSNFYEPESIGWKKLDDGTVVTVIAVKSPDTIRLFQCSGNVAYAEDSANISKGGFFKSKTEASPFSRNLAYTESVNPLASMAIMVGAGYTSDASGDSYNNFWLTQRGNTGNKFTGVIHHHAQAELLFHSNAHSGDNWSSLSVGWEYQILYPEFRGALGKFPIQLTKDNILIGHQSNTAQDGAVSVKNTSGACYEAYDGVVSVVGLDYATPGTSLYLGEYTRGTKIKTRWYLAQASRFRPMTDNASLLGEAAVRWSTVYAATGAINTSDEREKSAPLPMDDVALDAIESVDIVLYQWLDAISAKGDNSARWHFGVIAQRIRDAFEDKGLDGRRYGLLCYDEWEDEYEEVLDDEGAPTGEMTLTRSAGNRWGIRADQVAFAMLAASRRRMKRIEGRLSAAGI